MSQIAKTRIILYIGLLLMTLHFAVVTIYLVSPDFITRLYVYPYFHQNWNLFVPPPKTNYHLYLADKNYKIKQDLMADLVYQHVNNRLSGQEFFLLTLSNTIHYIDNSAQETATSNKDIVNTTVFKVLQKEVEGYKRYKSISDSEHCKVILYLKPTNNKKGRVFYD